MPYTLNINYIIDKELGMFYWTGSFDIKYNDEKTSRTIILQNSQNISELIDQVKSNINNINNKKYYLCRGTSPPSSNVAVVIYVNNERMEEIAQPLAIIPGWTTLFSNDSLIFKGDILNYDNKNLDNIQFFTKIKKDSFKYAQEKYKENIHIKIIKNISYEIKLEEYKVNANGELYGPDEIGGGLIDFGDGLGDY